MMKCPKCRMPTTVIESRPDRNNVVRRRRECMSCYHRFSTIGYEVIKTNKRGADVIRIFGKMQTAIDRIDDITRARNGTDKGV